jgi:hypothetical protein
MTSPMVAFGGGPVAPPSMYGRTAGPGSDKIVPENSRTRGLTLLSTSTRLSVRSGARPRERESAYAELA